MDHMYIHVREIKILDPELLGHIPWLVVEEVNLHGNVISFGSFGTLLCRKSVLGW